MAESEEMSQMDLIMEYFKKHPKHDIPHPEIVDWVTEEFKKRTGNVFRDPDRGIRKLSQEGQLIKIKMEKILKAKTQLEKDKELLKWLEDIMHVSTEPVWDIIEGHIRFLKTKIPAELKKVEK